MGIWICFLVISSFAGPKKLQCDGVWHPQASRLAHCEEIIEEDSTRQFQKMRSVLQWHAENGFPFATLLVQEFDSVKVWRLQRGDAWVKGDLLNRGKSKSPDSILARISLWKAGTPFSKEHIKLSLDRLARKGYFQVFEEHSRVFRKQGRNALHLGATIYDAPASSIQGIVLWTNEKSASWSGQIHAELRNLWGTARDFSLEMVEQNYYRELNLAWREPWLLDSPVGFEPSFQLRQQDSLWGERKLESAWTLDLDYWYFMALLLGIEQGWYLHEQDNMDRNSWWSGLRMRRDTRDRATMPRRGALWESIVRWYRHNKSGESQSSLRWEGNLQAVQPLTNNWILLGQGAGGLLLAKQAQWDPTQGFRLGGAQNLRGFREGQFLSQAWCLSSWEIHYRLLQGTALAAFVEASRQKPLNSPVWEEHMGYGLGIIQERRGWNLSFWFAQGDSFSPRDVLVHMRVRNAF